MLARAAKQDERISDLYATTGGNPFFVTEVLASEGTSVPLTVRDAVLARAARLSLAAREVLDAASVVPGRIETWLLDAVLAPPPVAVEECVERGMLRTEGDTGISARAGAPGAGRCSAAFTAAGVTPTGAQGAHGTR